MVLKLQCSFFHCLYTSNFFIGATTDAPLANSTRFGVNFTNSFPCPPGYYCESGDKVPRACPNGTYNALEFATDSSNCTFCPVNHYNHLLAQTACFHCGGQAKQPYQGQDVCECNGLHRVFLVGHHVSVELFIEFYFSNIENIFGY